jgi:predicted alpha/beta superfamily hydrolase
MRFLYFVILLSLLSSTGLSAKSSEKVGPVREHVIANAEEHALSSSITGRRYRIYIGYPGSYNPKSSKKYPVVYVTDGYWHFDRLCSIAPGLWLDGVAPEFIVVGIGYDDDSLRFEDERRYELTPTVEGDAYTRQDGLRSGGARKFLNSIVTEIIPYVETHTQADPSFRVLAGASFGGLFSLFAMGEAPGTFQGIVSVSPALGWDEAWLRRRHGELRDSATGGVDSVPWDLQTRLFMSVGDHEGSSFKSQIYAYNQFLKNTRFTHFRYQFRIIDGARHHTTSEAFTRGLHFVFAPLAKYRDFQ